MSTFSQASQSGSFTITVDLSYAGELSAGEVLEYSRLLKDSADGIQLAVNPIDGCRVSPLALAIMLQREGIDAIPCLDCRDRNRIALQSDLLGLRAAGITSIVLSEGRISRKKELSARPVFDASRRELVAMAQALNEEETGRADTSFLIGTPVTAFAPGPQWNAGELGELAGEGARFLQTQLMFDMEALRRYMQVLVDSRLTWSFAVIVTLAPLTSVSMARRLMDLDPRAQIPESLIDRLDSAGDPVREGIELCAEAMRAVAKIPGVSGIRLLCTGRPESTLAAIQASGLRNAYNS